MSSTSPPTLPKNIHSNSAVDSGPASSHFRVYQQTTVGSTDISIQIFIPATISAPPYYKTLIAKTFFHQILALTDTHSAFFSDLMTTVASYISLNTGTTEREAEAAVATIRSVFFRVSHLQSTYKLPILKTKK